MLWGQRNRLADANVRDRAVLVAQRILNVSENDIRYICLAVTMRPKNNAAREGWCEIVGRSYDESGEMRYAPPQICKNALVILKISAPKSRGMMKSQWRRWIFLSAFDTLPSHKVVVALNFGSSLIAYTFPFRYGISFIPCLHQLGLLFRRLETVLSAHM